MGLSRRAREEGVEVVGFCGHGLEAPLVSQATMNLAYRIADSRSLDGLVVFSNTLGTFHGPEIVAELMKERALPTVSLGFDLDPVISISARGYPAMQELVRHLIHQHSRRRFALVSGPLEHFESQEREAAFRAVLAEEGIPFDEELLFRGTFYTQDGRHAVNTLVAGGKPFDAVVCLNDHMAIGALDALRHHGFTLPADVSVTGFDDIEEAAWVSPPLTTVRQPLDELSSTALSLLLDQIRGVGAVSQVAECRVVLRSSCGCPPSLLEAGDSLSWPQAEQTFARLGQNSEPGGLVLQTIAMSLRSHWGETVRLQWWRRKILQQRSKTSDPVAWHDQALVWLAEEELRWERESRMLRDERQLAIKDHSVRLQGLLTLEAIVRYGEDHFPGLGIPRSYLVLFESPPSGLVEVPAKALWLTTRRNNKRALEKHPFETGFLVPAEAPFDWGTRGWLVEPLVYQDEALGYLLLECGTDEAVDFETLRETLSTAVKGALLMEEVEARRRGLAQQVREKTRELRAAHRDLQQVSHRTMQTIGQDIHDDLCQHLVGISMLTAIVEESVANANSVPLGAVQEIKSLVDSAVVRSRQFARMLFPPGLVEHGLVSALEDLVDTMSRPHGGVRFSAEGNCRVMQPDQALQLYRIVQESLSNALRHSGSEVILVRLVREADAIVAEVRDFGRGLPPGALGSGMGTRILKDRAETLGAQLEIYNLDPGVCVSCRLPLSPGDA